MIRGLALLLLASTAHAAVFAEDEAALRGLLAGGPHEISLRGHVYRGDFRIDRPVKLVGEPGTVLQGSGTGTVLEIHADDVVIDNLTIRGSGRRHRTEDAALKAVGARVQVGRIKVDDSLFGVLFESCHACALTDSHIRGTGDESQMRGDGIKLWEADDSVVRNVVVEDARDAVVWYSRRVRIENSTFRRNRYGAHFMYAHDAAVIGGRFENNVVGIFVMYSARVHIEDAVLGGARGAAGVGIGFKDSDGVAVRRCSVVGNTTGLYLDRSPRDEREPVEIVGTLLALNQVGVRLHSGQRGLQIAGNDFVDNATVVQVEGGGNALLVDFHENHWSDYAGYDLDGDGIGDVPYEVKRLSDEMTDARPMLRFFSGSAALEVVDVVSRAVPVLASQRLFIDKRPRIRGSHDLH
jgi:nitrous oxidase accessory protein